MIATLAPSWHDDHAHDLRCHSWDHRDTYLWLHLVLPTIAVHYQDYSHTFYFLESCSPLYRPQPSPGPSQPRWVPWLHLFKYNLYIIHIFSSHFIILPYYWLLPTISWIWFTLSSDLPEKTHWIARASKRRTKPMWTVQTKKKQMVFGNRVLWWIRVKAQ